MEEVQLAHWKGSIVGMISHCSERYYYCMARATSQAMGTTTWDIDESITRRGAIFSSLQIHIATDAQTRTTAPMTPLEAMGEADTPRAFVDSRGHLEVVYDHVHPQTAKTCRRGSRTIAATPAQAQRTTMTVTEMMKMMMNARKWDVSVSQKYSGCNIRFENTIALAGVPTRRHHSCA